MTELTLEHPPVTDWHGEDPDLGIYRLPSGQLFNIDDIDVDFFWDIDWSQQEFEESFELLGTSGSHYNSTTIYQYRECGMGYGSVGEIESVLGLFDEDKEWLSNKTNTLMECLRIEEIDPHDLVGVADYLDGLREEQGTLEETVKKLYQLDDLSWNCFDWNDFRNGLSHIPFLSLKEGLTYETMANENAVVFYSKDMFEGCSMNPREYFDQIFNSSPVYLTFTVTDMEGKDHDFQVSPFLSDPFDPDRDEIKKILKDEHGFTGPVLEAILGEIPEQPTH